LGFVDVSERGFTFTAKALPTISRIAVNRNKTRGTNKSRFTITTYPQNAFAKAFTLIDARTLPMTGGHPVQDPEFDTKGLMRGMQPLFNPA